jgi:hypothetical protein
VLFLGRSLARHIKNTFTKVLVFAKNSKVFTRFLMFGSSIPDGIF